MTYFGIYNLHHVLPALLNGLLSGLSEAQLESAQVTQEQRNDLMEEVTTEISVYFGMLYHFVEIFKGHDDFADELSESSCWLTI
jgi:hypothetical protein